MYITPGQFRLIFVFGSLLGLTLIGSLGYAAIEGWPLRDGFYMTIITLSTVGYGETRPLSDEGRWFTSLIIFLGIVGMTCCTATITSMLVGWDAASDYVKKRMRRMIASLTGHVVVCGTGLTARAVIDRLARKRQSIVVIDDDLAVLEDLKSQYRRIFYVEGKPTDELTLAEANILAAQHVVIALDSEIDNLLVAITCRDLGGDIAIHAECTDMTIANRMRKAGVNDVISPPQLCGEAMSALILA
ncbi:MAG TPA: hypothetical protein DCY79_15905 [Planctomycetaceae bacterium]|nr:hypothetical protein [Blastopirellula sp.]HAY81288.1 hypothetical protein [Planctomycetaceae bacterium]